MRPVKYLLILSSLFLILMLVACSSTSEPEEGSNPEESDGSSSDSLEIKISGFKFDPDVITIPVGSTVTWKNYDPAPHATVGDNGEWDSGGLKKDDTFSFTFDTPGTYTYHDSYYVTMDGTVEVTE